MIVPMLKTTVVCLDSDRAAALDRLAGLGLLHVKLENAPAPSAERQQLEQRIGNAERVFYALESFRDDSVPPEHGMTSEAVFAKASEQFELITEGEKKRDTLLRQRKQLEPWGDFSPAAVTELRQRGIYLYLCAGLPAQADALRGDDRAVEVVGEDKGKLYFAVFAREALDESTLPLVSLPELSLGEIDRQLQETDAAIKAAEREMAALAPALHLLEHYRLQLREQLEFMTNCEGMGCHEQLAYIGGYVPAPELDRLQAAAKEYGWAIHYEPADDDDRSVPTLLRIPKVFRPIEPLLQFLGIAPGYNEVDVSACLMLFLSMFFGMIIGDAGYGSVFLVAAIAGLCLVRKPEARRAVKLFTVFSCVTIVWGALSGTWFGMDSKYLPKFMRGIEWLSNPEYKDKNIQLFCFILAILHLTTGRLWAALLAWNKPRKALGELGWAIILWGNFFLTVNLLIEPGPTPDFVLWIYGAGLGLVVLFGVNWRDAGDVFNFPFGVIGSFVDILSYIRLYAVGMSGFYIANSFNNMGASLWHISPWLIVAGLVVIVFGHLLNLSLCGLGVLVHGVRLNTLEFSNHIGLRWAGQRYRPFAKIIDSRKQSK